MAKSIHNFIQAGKDIDLPIQAIPIGISGLTLFGITFSDWVLIGTGILLTFNLVFAGLKIYDRFFSDEE